MTASTLYEAVEPQILCKQLLGSITSEIIGDGKKTEAIQLTVFVLKSFAQDEEMQTIHLPILFAAIVDVIHVCPVSEFVKDDANSCRRYICKSTTARHRPRQCAKPCCSLKKCCNT